METVEVVIRIPKDDYEYIQLYGSIKPFSGNFIAKQIKDGTVLQKGHGRLIDADTYRKEMLDSREFDFFKRLDMQPTIIEADKEVENETISEN